MALIDELRARWKVMSAELTQLDARVDELSDDLLDYERAIAALEWQHNEPEAPAQADPPSELRSVPGAEEESRDHSDDGYAPVIDPEPETIGFFISEGRSIELRSDGTTAPLTPLADPIWNESEPEQERVSPFGFQPERDQ